MMFGVWVAALAAMLLWCVAYYKRERGLAKLGLLSVLAMPLVKLLVSWR